MKKIFLSLIGFIFIFTIIFGCGSSDYDTTIVRVERGPVFNAVVKDASGLNAKNIKGTNKYVFFTKNIKYPITASGGEIDANYDGKIDENDYPLTVELKSDKGLNITPLTTYLAKSTPQAKLDLIKKVGEGIDKLYLLPSEDNDKLLIAQNAAFEALYHKSFQSNLDIKKEFDNSYNDLTQELNSYGSGKVDKQKLTHFEEYINTKLNIPPYKGKKHIDLCDDTNDNNTNTDYCDYNDNITGI